MIFLANRGNLDRRSLHTRIKNKLGTQVTSPTSPVERVWYHTSPGDKVGVRASIDVSAFLGRSYPVDSAELQISFDFPPDSAFDQYAIQWVEADRDWMVGWHQDEAHPSLGACHLQLDYRGSTVQRAEATVLDAHPLNVFEQRMTDLLEILDAVVWDDEHPRVPDGAIR